MHKYIFGIVIAAVIVTLNLTLVGCMQTAPRQKRSCTPVTSSLSAITESPASSTTPPGDGKKVVRFAGKETVILINRISRQERWLTIINRAKNLLEEDTLSIPKKNESGEDAISDYSSPLSVERIAMLSHIAKQLREEQLTFIAKHFDKSATNITKSYKGKNIDCATILRKTRKLLANAIETIEPLTHAYASRDHRKFAVYNVFYGNFFGNCALNLNQNDSQVLTNLFVQLLQWTRSFESDINEITPEQDSSSEAEIIKAYDWFSEKDDEFTTAFAGVLADPDDKQNKKKCSQKFYALKLAGTYALNSLNREFNNQTRATFLPKQQRKICKTATEVEKKLPST